MKTALYYLYRGILHCMTIGGALLLILLVLGLFISGPRSPKNAPNTAQVEQSTQTEQTTQIE